MTKELILTDWLPTTKKEIEIRGWNEVDVVLFSGDAYVDHPSFGSAVIGRLMESMGLKVALVPQPDWRGDFRDFTKMGKPRLFFAISAGCMDSMVNHYTANKRLRSDDAYTAGGKAGSRPDYTTITYSGILKKLYPDTPILIGGIEASLRRLTHYDYWSDKLMPCILVDCKADLLVYGMGEKPIAEICRRAIEGTSITEMKDIPQTVFLRKKTLNALYDNDSIHLHSHEECLKNKLSQAENFRHIEEESNKLNANTIYQAVGEFEVVVNPPYPPVSGEELDRVYELPFTRLPHPKYKGKTIPAYDMIKFSVNIHRGCFGGCSFCTISAHQGKFIVNRSKESILREVRLITKMDDFKGYLSDLGGPSANMYEMRGKNHEICSNCKKPSCIHPKICNNLNTDHKPLIDLYKAVDDIPGIKKSFIGSGIRYDLVLNDALSQLNSEQKSDEIAVKEARKINNNAQEYLKEVVYNHVSGRLKVAPEHTNEKVLYLMRKPDFDQFRLFKKKFDEIENKRLKTETGGKQQLIPYFISSHPGCSEEDMAELAAETRELDFRLEQVQDFTPTPMTLSTEMFYTGYHPYTLKQIKTAKSKQEKLNQREYFFWYEKSSRDSIIRKLKRLGRQDLVRKLFG
jgi:uncharacterized radical SAM protein YgiQ